MSACTIELGMSSVQNVDGVFFFIYSFFQSVSHIRFPRTVCVSLSLVVAILRSPSGPNVGSRAW